jgi:hypothetical protein
MRKPAGIGPDRTKSLLRQGILSGGERTNFKALEGKLRLIKRLLVPMKLPEETNTPDLWFVEWKCSQWLSS